MQMEALLPKGPCTSLQVEVPALQKAPEVGQGAFGVQLRNDGRSKAKGIFLERSQRKKSMKSRELVRIHFWIFKICGTEEEKKHIIIYRLRLLDIM